jgi:hypothetical protein
VLGDAHGVQQAGRPMGGVKFGHTFQVLGILKKAKRVSESNLTI